MTGRPPSCDCGHCDKCCRAAYMREWYARKTSERGRPAIGDRDPEAARRSDAKRKGTARRRASLLAGSKRQREANPEKYKARTAVGNALRDKRLFRGVCEVCSAEKVEAHHNDYSKPLEVRWFCRPHHKALHGHLRPDYPVDNRHTS